MRHVPFSTCMARFVCNRGVRSSEKCIIHSCSLLTFPLLTLSPRITLPKPAAWWGSMQAVSVWYGASLSSQSTNCLSVFESKEQQCSAADPGFGEGVRYSPSFSSLPFSLSSAFPPLSLHSRRSRQLSFFPIFPSCPFSSREPLSR